jgi:hypothetical protein
MGKKKRSETGRGGQGPKSRRLSALQRSWLERITAVRPTGLVVEEGRARATIRSLLRRELIQEDGSPRPACYLTAAGAECVSCLAAGQRGGRGAVMLDVRIPGATLSLAAAGAPESVVLRDPVEGDAVLVAGLGTDPGRVKYVDNRVRKACVCLRVQDDSWVSIAKSFEELVILDDQVVNGACKDCPGLPRPRR